MPIEMRISRIALDPLTNMPIVILTERDGERSLPIWVGLLEASAIATRLEQVETARPMTHDLLKQVIDALGARVERVTVVNLESNTYFAVVNLVGSHGVEEIDSRPSDALALALRTGSPIYVEERVIAQASQADEGTVEHTLDPEDKDKLAEFLENLPSEQFGKYKQ